MERGKELECADKFGREILFQNRNATRTTSGSRLKTSAWQMQLPKKGPKAQDPLGFYEYVRPALRTLGFQYAGEILEE